MKFFIVRNLKVFAQNMLLRRTYPEVAGSCTEASGAEEATWVAMVIVRGFEDYFL